MDYRIECHNPCCVLFQPPRNMLEDQCLDNVDVHKRPISSMNTTPTEQGILSRPFDVIGINLSLGNGRRVDILERSLKTDLTLCLQRIFALPSVIPSL